MAKFKKGDVVKLKSGGPQMTVQNVGDFSMQGGGENGVYCVWFEKNGTKKQEGYFDEDVLMIHVLAIGGTVNMNHRR